MCGLRVSFLLLCALLSCCGKTTLGKPAEIRIERGAVDSLAPVTFSATANRNQNIFNDDENKGLERVQRSPDDDYEDYEDGPEGRHFKLKLKRKFKPHKHGHGGLLGGGHHGHGSFPGGGHYGPCPTLHGCGGGLGGWQSSHGGYLPIATAIAGPSFGGGHKPGHGGWNHGHGGGWNPGYGGYNRPGSYAQASTWNFGPFQAAFGLAQSG